MAETKAQKITLAVATLRYLEVLAARGTHGSNINDVARTFIEQGVRDAIREGFLSLADHASVASGSDAEDNGARA